MSTANDDLSGSELRRRRKALGLTQAAIAELLGITPTSVARWERGEQRPGHSSQLRAMLEGLRTQSQGLRTQSQTVGDVRASHSAQSPIPMSTANLRHELTSFVGREREIAEVTRDLLKTPLLTLTGPGGVGKTRLGLEVAERIHSDFADGACFVNLAPLVDAAAVPRAVLSAMGIRSETDRPELDTLIGRLGSRNLLLLLDNCEHLLTGCGLFADAVLRACSRLRILSTSREPLGVAGETVWPVPALSVPDGESSSSDELLDYEAPRLFVERARSANPSFTLRLQNTPSVAEICRSLDGMPLAIELAAGLVRSLTPAQIAARLGDRFRLLARGPRGAPARQQTLQATVDWSYELLTSAERALFNRLSVFVGGWTLEAAETVCSDEAVPSSQIVHLLGRLVDRSLVIAAEDQSEMMRYRLLETLRQYGAEQLALANEDAAVRDRHRDWCVTLAEQGEGDIWRADQLACVRQLGLEHDNVRAALAWTLTGAGDPEPALRIAAAMVRFWDVRGHLREGARWLRDLLALPTVQSATPGWARAVTARGYLAVLRGDRPGAIADLDQSIDFWRGLGDSRGMAVAMFFRALAVSYTGGSLVESVPIFREGLTLAHQRGPRWTAYFCLYALGEIARVQGDLVTADTLLNQSLSMSSTAKERWGAFHALYSLALLALVRGEWLQANELAQQSLTLTLELGDMRGSTYALEALGCVAAARGDVRRAAHLFGASEALREPVGDFSSATLRADRDQALATVRATLGEAGFMAATAAGRRLSLEQAVAVARAPVATGGQFSGLTDRERDIVALVARGLTNRQIADTLVVTERTAESHLSHIFAKLSMRSRTQLAAWAIESGILSDSTSRQPESTY